MKFRIIVKIGVALSILLFCIAVGLYSFASLKEAGKGKNFDLYSMIPDDCYGILDTDNIDYYINEFTRMSYAKHDSLTRYSDVMMGFLNDFDDFTSLSPHGIANIVSRIVLSIHDDGFSNRDVIAYFKVGEHGKKDLFDLLYRKYDSDIVVKSEKYRGKQVDIYSLGKTPKFLSVYSGDGFLAVSYQKRLIDRAIDAMLDNTSIKNDSVFRKIHSKKSVNYMTFYSREASFPEFTLDESDVWTEFELHMNSDVIYLSGSMFHPDTYSSELEYRLNNFESLSEDSILVVSGQDKVDSCISEVIASPRNSIFKECISNLSRDASYIMVADLGKVESNPRKYEGYIPDFIFQNIEFFRSFVLSLQVTEVNDVFSHIYVFTYKY